MTSHPNAHGAIRGADRAVLSIGAVVGRCAPSSEKIGDDTNENVTSRPNTHGAIRVGFKIDFPYSSAGWGCFPLHIAAGWGWFPGLLPTSAGRVPYSGRALCGGGIGNPYSSGRVPYSGYWVPYMRQSRNHRNSLRYRE